MGKLNVIHQEYENIEKKLQVMKTTHPFPIKIVSVTSQGKYKDGFLSICPRSSKHEDPKCIHERVNKITVISSKFWLIIEQNPFSVYQDLTLKEIIVKVFIYLYLPVNIRVVGFTQLNECSGSKK